ncbi:MAG: helix-turn-helix domain-containing protein [Oscillospiraceae bacterium]|nr:helix-turn-helix domain-containing protein [Oscillospiraceae bacterium]
MEQSNLAKNLSALRRATGLTQERAAEAVGVTRQALAKWESGETTPDVIHSDRLAELYGVSLDDLLHYDQKPGSVPPPPRGKHVFGVVQVGERGQIVIPKRARELFELNRGDTLVVLGDTNPGTAGIALVPAQFLTSLWEVANQIQEDADRKEQAL